MTRTRTRRIIAEGIVAGLVGALTVAVWFFFVDLIRGQPLLTPGALGSFVFFRIENLAEVQVTPGTVLGYSVIHVLLFGVFGILASAFIARAEKTPHLVLLGVVLFIVLQALFFGYLAIAAEFLLGNLAWWAIAAGNLLAAFFMGGFFVVRHPELRRLMTGTEPFEEP
jgi:hypothetical protein